MDKDYISFRDEIIVRKGEEFAELFETFAERALELGQQGLLHNAIADGQFALELFHYQKEEQYAMEYFIDFLIDVALDLKKIDNAKAYYKFALAILEVDDEDYELKNMLDDMRKKIEGREKKN